MPSPRVSVYVALSLDGFIAREDGGLDWLERVQEVVDEDYGYQAFLDSVDAVVLGRNTYDAVLGFGAWPFMGKRVIVLTRRPIKDAEDETAHVGELRPLFARLHEQGIERVYLDGGVAIQQGLAEGLVDDLTLSWIPVLLGTGRRLFAADTPESHWTLKSSRSYETGLLQVHYEREEPV